MDACRSLIEQSYRLRYRVFVEEKKWQALVRDDRRDVDQFDNDDAVHLLYVDSGGSVLGCQRMLPSTKPHLMSVVLPQLCDGEQPTGANIWEWTRYAVDPSRRDRGRMLSPIAISLLTGLVEWGLIKGIDTIIIQMNPLWLLRLVQLHFRVTPLGFPQEIDGEATIAVTAAFNRSTLAKLREIRGSDESVLMEEMQIAIAEHAA